MQYAGLKGWAGHLFFRCDDDLLKTLDELADHKGLAFDLIVLEGNEVVDPDGEGKIIAADGLKEIPKVGDFYEDCIVAKVDGITDSTFNALLLSLDEWEGKEIEVEKKLKGAGCSQPVFEEGAVEAILNAADGTPRMISKLCNASLVIGHSKSINLITADPDDNKFVDCAVASGATYIVSNDHHFQELKLYKFPQVDVRSLIDFLEIVRKL